MKSIISFIGISAISMAALFAVTHTEQVQDTIKWNKTTHDFGTVKLGPKPMRNSLLKMMAQRL